jgi:hypothetical protein
LEVLNNQLLTYPHEQKGCPCDKAHRLRDNWGESHPSLAEEKSTHTAIQPGQTLLSKLIDEELWVLFSV